jgi:hypothetical protein
MANNTSGNINTLSDIAKRYGIFAALFIGLLIFVLNGYQSREDKLMVYLDKQAEINKTYLNKQSEINSSIATTLEKIDVRLQRLECK